MKKTQLNIDKIKSGARTHDPRCAMCGRPITPANDSGWEVFVKVEGETKTMPVCAWCDVECMTTTQKADE